MKKFVVGISLVLASMVYVHASFAQEKSGPSSYVVRKIIDPKDGSVMFFSCQGQACRVLGGGSFSKDEVHALIGELRYKHYAEMAGIVAFATGQMVLNPVMMISFMSIPAGIISFAVSTASVTMYHQKADSYKQYAVMQEANDNNHVTKDVAEAIELNLSRYRRLIESLQSGEQSYQYLEPISGEFTQK